MIARLSQHKSGSRLTLRDDDLLHALIMPPSLNVHIVRLIVSKSGELEFAEWVTGEDGKYSHRVEHLGKNEVASLVESLSHLHAAEQTINFDGIDFDYDEYEHTERKVLRFWVGDLDRELFLPTSDFYKHYEISEEIRKRYEHAFDSVCAKLPLEWMGDKDRVRRRKPEEGSE